MRRKVVLFILVVFGISSIVMPLYIKSAKATWVQGDITQNATWTNADSPYVVIDNIIVDPNVTLTIDPNTEIRFGGSFSIEVAINASLIAIGNSGAQINFTSNQLKPAKNNWNTIQVLGGVRSNVILDFCSVSYATNALTLEGSNGMVEIENCILRNCTTGISLALCGANTTIAKNTITLNDYGLTTSSDFYNVRLFGNTFSYNSNFALQTVWSDGTVHNIILDRNNVFQNGYGFDLTGAPELYNMTISNNNIYSNFGDGIKLMGTFGGIADINITNNQIYSNKGYGIMLNPQGGIDVYDINVSQNDVYANNNDGISLILPEEWLDRVGTFYNNTVSKNYVTHNEGNGLVISNNNGGAYGNSIFDNIISSNSADGIDLYTWTSQSADTNKVVNNSIASQNIGLNLQGSFRAYVLNCSIMDNRIGVMYDTTEGNKAMYNNIYGNTAGMNVTNGGTCNATYNYWGDPSGPYHISLNPTGKGNPVGGNGEDLKFIPFLVSPQGQIRRRPIAALSVDNKSPGINETVTFSAMNSTSDGRIDFYFFDFGDGSNSSWTSLSVVTHAYSQKATYYATVTVMDDYGLTSNNTQQVKIQIIVVSEYQLFLILPVFMIATLIVVMLFKKKRNVKK